MRMLSRTMTTLGMKEYHLVMQAGTHGGYHLGPIYIMITGRLLFSKSPVGRMDIL